MRKSAYRLALETYLATKEAQGEPLPGTRGQVSYKAISAETGIPYSKFVLGSEVRVLVDSFLEKLGVSKGTTSSLPRLTPQFDTRTPPITYGDLKHCGHLWLRERAYSPASIASYKSHLSAFMRHFERTKQCSPGDDLGSNFEVRLHTFISTTTGSKASASALRLWSQIYRDLCFSITLPSDFATTLTELVKRSGRTRMDIARAAGMKSGSMLSKLMQGDRIPADRAEMDGLERALGVTPGTLGSKLGVYRVRSATVIPKEWWPETWQRHFGPYGFRRDKVVGMIPEPLLRGSLEMLKPAFDEALQKVLTGNGELIFSRKLKNLQEKGYLLVYKNWPKRLQEEFQALVSYKTASSGLSNKKRRGRWNEETARMGRKRLESFFGFLCLPVDHPDRQLRGMGMAVESLTLAWLAVQEVVERFLDFRCLRSEGHSHEAVTFITTWAALLQPESGWLWINPELSSRLPEQQRNLVEAAGGWTSYCVSVHAELRESLKSLRHNGLINQTRNPMMPIAPILDEPEPLSLVISALRLTRQHLEAGTRSGEMVGQNLAVRWRDYVMISLLARLPLRAKQLGRLTYRSDGSGYLQKHYRDGWRLVLPHKDFKNARNRTIFASIGREGVVTLKFSDFELLNQLVPTLEFYLEHVLPVIGSEEGYLFPTRQGTALSRETIYSQVTNWTRNYLSQFATKTEGIPNVFPFGPHAFRDIVATHIIKTTGSISLAANILLDSEEMVKQHYARFLPEDRLKLAMQELVAVFAIDNDE